MTNTVNTAAASGAADNCTILPDGSAFAVGSFPLPQDHWLYAPHEYEPGANEPKELLAPILTYAQRTEVVAAVRYAVRGATMCGKELDFDPDALVQNAVYALCGPFGRTALATTAQAAQQGMAYAALPDEGEPWRGHKFKEVQRGCWRCDCGKTIKEAASDQSIPASGGNYPVMPKRYTVDDDGEELFTAEKMRAFADATHALRVESLAAAYCEELDKLSQRNYELRLASHGQAPAPVLHLVNDAFAEVAMAYPKAFALHKVGIADTAVREALAAPAGATEEVENIRSILARCRDFIDTTKAPPYPAGADLADEIDVLLAAQPAPTYKDSTPELHIGDSAFESWYSTYSPAYKSDKQRARDAYEGAREDLSIWKRRALEAERDLRTEKATTARLVAGLNAKNGPTRMGEPATQPAHQQEAQEPVAVVVPCHTPSGKRVALYSAKQDLPIGTQLYTAPQPSPAAQGCALDVVLDAFENKTRGIPQAHIAAALVAELRAAIETASTTPTAQVDALESEYQRGYRQGYEQRDAEVRGALV